MKNRNTHFILEELEKHSYSKEGKDLYDLILQYPDRIHFVKDHNGVKNLLFFSTKEAEENVFENSHFCLFTKNQKDANTYEAYVYYLIDDVYFETKQFLDNTDETLYVNVGFVESEVVNDDYWRVLYLLEETKCAVTDAFVTLRRFPQWYDDLADYPFFIQKEESLLNEMIQQEKDFLIATKYKVLEKLKAIIEKNDEEEFEKLCEQMRIIKKQISE